MARYLKVQARITVVNPERSHRLQAWVADSTDVSPGVFVYQRYPPLPEETEPDDKFVNIASASDMAEYPLDEPVDAQHPFFRRTSIDLVFRSVAVMNQSWASIQADIRELMRNLNRLDALGTDITVEFT